MGGGTKIVALLASLLALGPLLGCKQREAPAAPRHLLLITVDTLRADYVGAYGRNGNSPTPAIDSLAAAGVRFSHAWTTAPLTLPAHASILTGLTPAHHGVRLNGTHALAESVPTLAEELASQGWDTGAFVAAYVLARRFGLARGFSVYDDRIPLPAYAGARLEAERAGSQVVDAAIEWLRHRHGKFFLWVHLYEPHAPYEPPPPFREKFPDDPYAGEVAAADAQVSRLLEELQRLGLAQSTVVAVVGDHGEALGDHGESTHGLLLYEPTTRVPLVLWAPGLLPSGKVVATPVSLVDLPPTLARLAGASTQERFARDGRDLSPWLKKGEEPPGTTLFAETLYPGSFGWAGLFAVRHGKWKYVAAPSPELFDLEGDPGETANLWATKPSQATPLQEALLAHLSETATSQNVTLDTEARRQLSSLGYVAPASPTPQTAADPKDMVQVFATFEKAHALRLAGQLQQAAELLRQALGKDPRNPVLLAELAETSRALGEARTAVALYQRVLEINPADREARYNLALALREAGQEEQAFQALETAIRLDPGRPELHEALGVVLAARGEFAKAREAFERACQLDPHNPRIWNNLGNVLREQGRLEEAEGVFRRALDKDPGYAEAWNGLGVVQVEKGQTEAAVASFHQALLLAPENLEVRLNLAIAWDEAGKREEARRAYQEFLVAARGKPEFREQLALARTLLGRLEQVQVDGRR